jgi:hypothetical protein
MAKSFANGEEVFTDEKMVSSSGQPNTQVDSPWSRLDWL